MVSTTLKLKRLPHGDMFSSQQRGREMVFKLCFDILLEQQLMLREQTI